MRHEPVSHKELDDAIEAIRHMPRLLRVFAVKAELVEQEKEHRDIRQEALSAIFEADPRILLIWTGGSGKRASRASGRAAGARMI